MLTGPRPDSRPQVSNFEAKYGELLRSKLKGEAILTMIWLLDGYPADGTEFRVAQSDFKRAFGISETSMVRRLTSLQDDGRLRWRKEGDGYLLVVTDPISTDPLADASTDPLTHPPDTISLHSEKAQVADDQSLAAQLERAIGYRPKQPAHEMRERSSRSTRSSSSEPTLYSNVQERTDEKQFLLWGEGTSDAPDIESRIVSRATDYWRKLGSDPTLFRWMVILASWAVETGKVPESLIAGFIDDCLFPKKRDDQLPKPASRIFAGSLRRALREHYLKITDLRRELTDLGIRWRPQWSRAPPRRPK